jgi:hypothetical protein
VGLRINANEYPLRTSAVDVVSHTACGWCQIVSDTGSGSQPVYAATRTYGTNLDVMLSWEFDSDPGNMYISSFNGVGETRSVFASRPSTGDWFFWYVIVATGANGIQAGWRRLDDASYVTAAVTTQTTTATGAIRLGNDGFSQWADSRLGAFKLWSTSLALAEVEAERLSFAPQRTANLVQWSPMVDAAKANCLLDFSGNGNNFTESGTLTVEGGPPVRFRQGRRKIYIPAAAVGGTTGGPLINGGIIHGGRLIGGRLAA